MSKPQRPSSGRTNFASCVVATLFLIFVVIIILIVFFTVFKPKDPRISVHAVQLPAFSITNGSVAITFSQYASVKNPNRVVFSHYDSSLQLIYGSSQVGFMFIPAGKISAGHTQYMAATFAVHSFAVMGTPPEPTAATFTDAVNGVRFGPTLEIESRLVMAGRVRILNLFTHHVEAKAVCKVAIAVGDGSVLGFHC